MENKRETASVAMGCERVEQVEAGWTDKTVGAVGGKQEKNQPSV